MRYILLSLLILSACTKQNNPTGASIQPQVLSEPAPNKVVDISKIQPLGSLNINVDTNPLDFGPLSPSNNVATQYIQLTNPTAQAITISTPVIGQVTGANPFSVLFNHCGTSLSSGQSCTFAVASNVQGFYNTTGITGSVSLSIGDAPGAVQYSVPLQVEVVNNPDPSQTGTATLRLSMDSGFSTLVDSSDPRPYRIITIANTGSGNLMPYLVNSGTGLNLKPGGLLPGTADMSVLLSHCSSSF